RIADDEQRIPELLELLLDSLAVEVVALDHESRAVAVGRELLVNCLDVELLARRGCFGQGLACRRRSQAAHDLEQARAARVDNPSLAQHLELLRRPRYGLFATLHEPGQKLWLGQAVVLRALPFLSHLADDGKHRSLDRLAHGAIRSVARRTERLRER